MKKSILILAAIFSLGTNIAVVAQDGQLAQVYVQDGWKKANDGYWQGMYEGKSYWYKMDESGNLQRSSNGKSWSRVDDAMWMDNSGRWVRVTDNTLMWSEDKGKMWTPVPDRQWQSSNGNWYKFDGGWTVWSREKQ
ncbi:MAG: hypothetical protein V4616_09715 [Bacteroidota bacterium]